MFGTECFRRWLALDVRELTEAVRAGDLQRCRVLLEAGSRAEPMSLAGRAMTRETPLLAAIETRRWDIVRILVPHCHSYWGGEQAHNLLGLACVVAGRDSDFTPLENMLDEVTRRRPDDFLRVVADSVIADLIYDGDTAMLDRFVTRGVFEPARMTGLADDVCWRVSVAMLQYLYDRGAPVPREVVESEGLNRRTIPRPGAES